MELSLWTYEGPPHVGAMRIANSMRDVHYVLHAPQGDTYADLLFTMIERNDHRPPVTYSTFQARDLGADTAGLLKQTIRSAYDRYQPRTLLVGESCTAELIQDQPGSLARGMGIPVPVVSLELPAYSKKENWGASETLYYMVRQVLSDLSDQVAPSPPASDRSNPSTRRRPLANILGPASLGFRCRDDVTEIRSLLDSIGIDVNTVVPLDATVDDLLRLPAADFNICLYPEVARTLCTWLQRTFEQPFTKTVPIGVNATLDFIGEIEELTGVDASAVKQASSSRLPWYSRSVDSTYLTGKRVFIFGDGSHVIAAARIARDELGFEVVGIGTFSREMARDVRAVAKDFGIEALISDDYLAVEERIEELQPELVLGTQMERHVAKRLGIACAVISTPIHVQDFPARYSPQMGFEGANVIFDTWVHPLMMGLEEHLVHMFREDFEFNDRSASHLHRAEREGTKPAADEAPDPTDVAGSDTSAPADVDHTAADPGEPAPTRWAADAERELGKIPFFVRGKARRNTETYARMSGVGVITLETLYDAKAHFAR